MDEFGNKIRVKKKTINESGKAKLGLGNYGGSDKTGSNNLGSKSKVGGKFTYRDADGNLVTLDEEPKDFSKFERPPYMTHMVTNRLNRVQTEINKLEEKKHFKFDKGNIIE